MSFPASWARIPVTATYLLRDEAGTPATGRIEFRSAQIVVADGSIIVPVRVTITDAMIFGAIGAVAIGQ